MAENIDLLPPDERNKLIDEWNQLSSRYLGAQNGEPSFATPRQTAGQSLGQQPLMQPSQGSFSVMGGPGAGGVGPQVTNLSQLQQVASVLGRSGIPPELRDLLFSRLTGIPFRSERQVAMENALAQVRQKQQLEAPMKEAEFGRRLEEMAMRQENMGATRDYQQQLLQMRQEAMQNQRVNQLKALHDIGQTSGNPNVKAVISQIILRALGQLQGRAEGQQAPLDATFQSSASAPSKQPTLAVGESRNLLGGGTITRSR